MLFHFWAERQSFFIQVWKSCQELELYNNFAEYSRNIRIECASNSIVFTSLYHFRVPKFWYVEEESVSSTFSCRLSRFKSGYLTFVQYRVSQLICEGRLFFFLSFFPYLSFFSNLTRSLMLSFSICNVRFCPYTLCATDEYSASSSHVAVEA